ncbi:hypothetical protein FHS42_003112 [Streptomyces zagrosensis]|uniref:Uncharacterized protein n=1 Tax=Streptomyces zagrosensis TaxID=1042984 RepID=A0A7W9QA80_9ACTN|nr:hypothetical protein [Streptomyces zagrosensis]
MHDLHGALEDPIDPQVTQDLLGGHRTLTASRQRGRRLETATTADLHEFVSHQTAHLGAV